MRMQILRDQMLTSPQTPWAVTAAYIESLAKRYGSAAVLRRMPRLGPLARRWIAAAERTRGLRPGAA